MEDKSFYIKYKDLSIGLYKKDPSVRLGFQTSAKISVGDYIQLEVEEFKEVGLHTGVIDFVVTELFAGDESERLLVTAEQYGYYGSGYSRYTDIDLINLATKSEKKIRKITDPDEIKKLIQTSSYC